MDKTLLIVLTTVSNFQYAKKLTKIILEKKLASCVNLNDTYSLYWWKGKIEEGSEVKLTIKTRQCFLNELYETIKKYHSYDIPEFIYFEASSSKEYNEWISDVI
ncbi:Periplasmic divalent cation tolerance protein CutA [Prochlorococcus sp. MIT 0602]|nr:Periplasmic divalent cation tolerance protein CutA [Prochlorococcus sp. MIT 0602]